MWGGGECESHLSARSPLRAYAHALVSYLFSATLFQERICVNAKRYRQLFGFGVCMFIWPRGLNIYRLKRLQLREKFWQMIDPIFSTVWTDFRLRSQKSDCALRKSIDDADDRPIFLNCGRNSDCSVDFLMAQSDFWLPSRNSVHTVEKIGSIIRHNSSLRSCSFFIRQKLCPLDMADLFAFPILSKVGIAEKFNKQIQV